MDALADVTMDEGEVVLFERVLFVWSCKIIMFWTTRIQWMKSDEGANVDEERFHHSSEHSSCFENILSCLR